jgi:hypothetical protein
MARKPTEFAEAEMDDEVEVVETETVVNDDFVNARIKGTWKMFWGRLIFDFEDGKKYRIPRDLFVYLKANGNIYDTMA